MLGGTHQASLLLQLILIHSLDQIDSAILSRNKTITSSSTFRTMEPERAINGNPSRDYFDCASTSDESNPWYELDLGRNYTVHRIHVEGPYHFFGRYGSFHRIQIYLESVNANLTFGEKPDIIEFDRNYVDFVLPVPKSTRYVSLVMYGYGVILRFVICELTVYGDCADGEFGDYCEHTCHCDGDPCNKTSGVCPTGKCLPGYEGTFCNEECADGEFGDYCNHTCHCDGHPCNKTSGVCPTGKCLPGYEGTFCNEECIMGTYGEGCTMRCGFCANWTACNKTNGACLACEPGFSGTECKSTKRMEEFGMNESLLLIISGWIFGGVTLLAAVGIIICIKIRTRRTKQRPPQNDTRLYEIPTINRNEEEHQYEITSGNA